MSINGGFIILDKDSGMSSRAAGGRIARMFGTRKFGHIGTLDPMASGVLPIALGGATKMIPFVEEAAAPIKEYLFSMRFGFETDTLDITGKTTRECDVTPNDDDIRAAAASLVGGYMQTPPLYSAVHIDGVRAYDLARRGRVATPPARHVDIYELEILGKSAGSYHFRARVGRGTYIRAIARDIAYKCGALCTVDMIRRTETNGFLIKNAVKLDFLENLVNNGADVQEYLHAPDFGLGDIPVGNLNQTDASFYKNGGFVEMGGANGLRRVYSGEVFLGIGVVTDGVLRPKRTI